jgi:glutamate receptor, ionotropic, invertebrate
MNISKKNKLIIVSIRDDPFFMIRTPEPGKNFTGNDRFTGYCVDLARKLSEILDFSYELRLVKDNKFGNRDADGHWNGIVGELIRGESDISIAPLTISSERERAIEFTTPFMNIGISIMIKKPKKEKPGVFSFMAPLDKKIWLCVILAFMGVSLTLYLVSRFSPYEWHYDSSKNDHTLTNDFTIRNTLWFNLAALMQQGVDIAPKSVSGRVVASAWWFFTLILISSYTANLAAFLTVERMVSPIESAEDLVKQTEIQYGALEGGSTEAFFRNSKVVTYQRMWSFMQSWGPSVMVKSNLEGAQKVRESKGKYAYLLESSVNEYLNELKPCETIKVGNNLDSKGYGIATQIKSPLRDKLNLAILQMREEGFLDELKMRWWYDKSECGNQGSTKDSSQNALNLINVAGIFYILIVGLVMSVIVALLELFYKAKLQSKTNKVNLSFCLNLNI